MTGQPEIISTSITDKSISTSTADESKTLAEAEKLRAEAEKLRAEAYGAQQSWKKLWQRPAAWGTLLPGIAAIGTAIYGYSNGYFDARKFPAGYLMQSMFQEWKPQARRLKRKRD